MGSSAENNKKLLEAIKNKFADKTLSDSESSSALNFQIPVLQQANEPSAPCPGTHSQGPFNTVQSSVILNQFILKQLSEKQTNSFSSNGFVVPQLQLPNSQPSESKDNAVRFIIPLLQNLNVQDDNTNTADTNSGVNEIVHNSQMDIEDKSSHIDLTTALSCTKSDSVTNLKRFEPKEVKSIDFEIPFIECDRKERMEYLDNINCQIKYKSYSKHNRTLTRPSSFGQICCLKYKNTNPLPKLDHSFKVKHKIQRFRFNTKSPDDLVQAALSKNKQRKY